jgi:hypothetical protein
MDLLFLAFIAIGLLLLLVLVIYLVDRVNALEKDTKSAIENLNATAHSPIKVAVGPFAGLSAKKLWDAMTGRPPEDVPADSLGDVRNRYETVLMKHIESIFEEGKRDGSMGVSSPPKNTRQITTLRGNVESWLPMPQVNAIYQCGVDAHQKPPEQQAEVRMALDDACNQLFSKTQIAPKAPISQTLMGADPAAPVLPLDPALPLEGAAVSELPAPENKNS